VDEFCDYIIHGTIAKTRNLLQNVEALVCNELWKNLWQCLPDKDSWVLVQNVTDLVDKVRSCAAIADNPRIQCFAEEADDLVRLRISGLSDSANNIISYSSDPVGIVYKRIKGYPQQRTKA